MKKPRITIASALIVVMTFGSPIPASALLPQFVGTVLYYGGTAEFAGALIASAATVATLLGFAHIKSQEASVPQLQVQLSPDAALPVPPGWTGGAAGGESNPPATSGSPTTTYTAVGQAAAGVGSSPAQACANMVSQLNQGGYGWDSFLPLSVAASDNTGCLLNRSPSGTIDTRPSGMFMSSTCPTGYAVSGSSCVLSNPAIVPKPEDGKCSVKRTGNIFVYDSRDTDCQQLPPQVTVTANTVTVQGNDGSSSTITIDPGTGVITAQQKTPNADGTTTQSTAIVGPPSGATAGVTGVNTATFQGQGSLMGSSPLPSLQLPTDYNRETTQQGIKGAVDGINSKLDPAGQPTALASARSDYETKETAHKDLIQGIGEAGLSNRGITWSWSPVIPSTNCWEPAFMIAGREIVFNWCSKIELLKQIFAWAFFILTAFGIFEMFTKKGG